MYANSQYSIMDWIAEQWPWMAVALTALAKMIRDHIMIGNHEDRIEELEDIQQEQRIMQAELSRDVKHTRTMVDRIADELDVNKDDIKDIIRRNNE